MKPTSPDIHAALSFGMTGTRQAGSSQLIHPITRRSSILRVTRKYKMSTESHRKYLEKVALREAQKALNRNPQISRAEIRALKIQTIEPWKRIIAGTLSAGMAVTGFLLLQTDASAAGPWLLGLGLLGILGSIFGWRRTLDALSNAIDIGDILEAIF